MNEPVIHLVQVGDAQGVPCRRCGKTLWQMAVTDQFTTDVDAATCETRAAA